MLNKNKSNSTTLLIQKTMYTETNVRKALYWLSENCQWKLEETSDSWKVSLLVDPMDMDKNQAEIQRLLNDFKLRETLDRETKHLRCKIIDAALKRIAEPDGTR